MTNAIITSAAFDNAIKLIRDTGKRTGSAMAIARGYMQNEEQITGACKAMSVLDSEYAALKGAARKASTLKIGVRAFYKNMSTAVSHERAALRVEIKDEIKELEKLYAAFPFRILREKGCYIVVTHAEFDAATSNRRKSAGTDDTNEGADESDTGTDTAKGIDKAAAAIAALESALAEMTADRDAWRTRAKLAEHALKDATKPVRAAKPAKTSKKKAA